MRFVAFLGFEPRKQLLCIVRRLALVARHDDNDRRSPLDVFRYFIQGFDLRPESSGWRCCLDLICE